MSNADSEKPEVLCIYGSPRAGGNTDTLMDEFVAGVEEAGGVAVKIILRDLKISPCLELYRCRKFGECAINDDMTPIYEKLRSASFIALATPVMFYGVSAHTKAFIDRAQALWCLKYMLKGEVAKGRAGRLKGLLLSVGGSKGLKLFEGVRMTFKYFLDALDGDLWGELYLRGVDVRGDAKKQPVELAKARKLGIEAVKVLKAAGDVPR